MTSEEFPDTVSDDDPAFDIGVSHHARVYDYRLGGKDHYAADRAYAEALDAVYPGVAATARANWDFLGRGPVPVRRGETVPAPGYRHGHPRTRQHP